MEVELQHTNDDNGAVLFADCNISTSLVAEACHIRAFGADNPGEDGPVGQSEEANMRHALGIVDGFLNHFLGAFQTGLITGLESPLGISILCSLIVRDHLPLNLGGRFVLNLVNPSSYCIDWNRFNGNS